MFAHEKLSGLDRERLLEVVEPVLRAHGVEGVEIIWRSDHRGWVLYLTVEFAERSEPGAGVTLDLCADISRDLSQALDVADFIQAAYRLEVGSPGLERALYRGEDYRRFAGQLAKIKLEAPVEGQFSLRGELKGLDEQGRVIIDSDFGEHAIDFDNIRSGQLVLDLGVKGQRPKGRRGSHKRSRASHTSR